MERPDFIKIIISSVLFDLVLVFLAPALGYVFLLALLVLLFGIPLYVGVSGVKPALDYMSRERRGDVWSGLSHLMCGSGLIFLLIVTALEFLGDPNEAASPLEVLLWIYVAILFLRFSAAAFLNLLVGILCLFRCKGNDRLSAGAAILCSSAGLAMGHDLLSLSSDGGPDYMILSVFVLVNFLYGLGCGGAVQWLIREVAKPEES